MYIKPKYIISLSPFFVVLFFGQILFCCCFLRSIFCSSVKLLKSCLLFRGTSPIGSAIEPNEDALDDALDDEAKLPKPDVNDGYNVINVGLVALSLDCLRDTDSLNAD